MEKRTVLFLTVFLGVVFLIGIGQMAIRKEGDFSLPVFTPRSAEVAKLTDKVVKPTLLPTEAPVSVSIDFSNGKKLSGNVPAKTAYEALVFLAQKNNLEVEAKQYKFGKMVVKIGSKENSTDAAWTYSVNGEPGKIASDVFLVNPKDKIEWVYKKI